MVYLLVYVDRYVWMRGSPPAALGAYPVLERRRGAPEQPGQNIRIADEIVTAVAGADGPHRPEFVRFAARIRIPEHPLGEGVDVDLLSRDGSVQHSGDDGGEVVCRVAAG